MNYISEEAIVEVKTLLNEGQVAAAFEALTTPLHEALFKHQTFDLLDVLSIPERVTLSFDYIRTQVDAGGFIQLIQNGYISLVLTVIEGLHALNICKEMTNILDSVLKVYVLNIDTLSKETSVEEFAKLYNEFKEFDILEENFNQNKVFCMQEIIKIIINTNK